MMALQTPRICLWPFHKAPSRLRELFREGKDLDWVASVPEAITGFTENHFLRWQQFHTVSAVRLPDGSVIYWGAPRESITMIADQHTQPHSAAPAGTERRVGARVALACATWYETGSNAHKRTGVGRVIDISSTGVAFTTESLLRRGTRVSLHIQWPIKLEGDVPVELFVAGKLVRSERTKAALQYDRTAFRLATP